MISYCAADAQPDPHVSFFSGSAAQSLGMTPCSFSSVPHSHHPGSLHSPFDPLNFVDNLKSGAFEISSAHSSQKLEYFLPVATEEIYSI